MTDEDTLRRENSELRRTLRRLEDRYERLLASTQRRAPALPTEAAGSDSRPEPEGQ
jgi:phytoene/squalene synthetase